MSNGRVDITELLSVAADAEIVRQIQGKVRYSVEFTFYIMNLNTPPRCRTSPQQNGSSSCPESSLTRRITCCVLLYMCEGQFEEPGADIVQND